MPAVCAAFGGAGGRTVSGSSPHADLVAHTLAYLAQPQPPDFLTLYFSDVDHAGHGYGPDSPAVGAAVGAVNAALDALLAGMAALGVLDSTHLLLVSDHGMAPTCAARRVILDDLLAATTEYGSLGAGGVAAALDAVRRNGTGWTGGTSVALPAASPAAARALAAQMSASPAAFDADGSRVFAAYAKQDLPQPRMGGFGDSGRVPAVVGVPYVGWTVATAASLAACKGGPDRCCGCGGSHGFDNAYQAMAALFIGRGPRFAPGALVPGFTPNVELYNVMADICARGWLVGEGVGVAFWRRLGLPAPACSRTPPPPRSGHPANLQQRHRSGQGEPAAAPGRVGAMIVFNDGSVCEC